MIGNSLSTVPFAQRHSQPWGMQGTRTQPTVSAARSDTPPDVRPRPASSESVAVRPGTASNDGLYTRTGTTAKPAASTHEAMYQSASLSHEETFNLTIQTAEGDVATIRLAQSQSASSSSGYAVSTQGAVATRSQSIESNMNLEMTVTGDINAEESKAIQELMDQINQVADQFFSGDTDAAISSASTVALQGNTLQAFDVNMRTHEVQRASAAYQNVASYTDDSQSTYPAAPSTPTAAMAVDSPLAERSGIQLIDDDAFKSLKTLLTSLFNTGRELLSQPQPALAKFA